MSPIIDIAPPPAIIEPAPKGYERRNGLLRPKQASNFIINPYVFAGGATFPVVETTQTSGNASSTTTAVVTMPSGVTSGDLLLVHISLAQDRTSTFPGGWTEIYDQISGTSAAAVVAYKVSDGTEGASISVTFNSDAPYAAQAIRITNFTGTPSGSAATGDSTAPNPPNLAPAAGSQKYLWIIFGSIREGSVTYTEPANYTDGFGATFSLTTCRAAFRELEASSEDPGAWSTTASTRPWIAGTVAVQGA